MKRTMSRLFDSRTQAEAAIRDLEAMGLPNDDLSMIARHSGAAEDRSFEDKTRAAEGAGKGAATGGLIGGGAGLLAGLGMLAIPGLGPVVAAGWLASTAVGAVAGAAAGGATGGLLGALKHEGVDEADANVYAEGVRRGGTLVSVRADESMADKVQAVFDRNDGVDAVTRGAIYREEGWTSFDENAPYEGDIRGMGDRRPI